MSCLRENATCPRGLRAKRPRIRYGGSPEEGGCTGCGGRTGRGCPGGGTVLKRASGRARLGSAGIVAPTSPFKDKATLWGRVVTFAGIPGVPTTACCGDGLIATRHGLEFVVGGGGGDGVRGAGRVGHDGLGDVGAAGGEEEGRGPRGA